jgi:hypothetical protein
MGDLGDIEAALRAATPNGGDLAALADALAENDQRDAVLALQAARWSTGDPVDARARLRAAFARGPRWRAQPARTPEPLPPLYPTR